MKFIQLSKLLDAFSCGDISETCLSHLLVLHYWSIFDTYDFGKV